MRYELLVLLAGSPILPDHILGAGETDLCLIEFRSSFANRPKRNCSMQAEDAFDFIVEQLAGLNVAQTCKATVI